MARTRERERRAHRPLNSAALKKREDQQGGMFDSLCKEEFKTFRPKAGQNTIRFLEGTWPDAEHWAHDTWIHNQIGPDNGRYFCLQKMLNKPCPLCDERRALMAAGETEAAKAIAPRKGACAWVINRDDEDAGPLLWFYGRTVDEEFAGRCRDRKTGEPIDIIHPDEGNDVFFKMTKKGKEASNVEYSAYEIDRDPTPIHDKEKTQNKWLDYTEENPVPDCFQYFDADYLQKLITGSQMAKAASEDDDEDAEEDRPRGRRRARDDDDEDEAPSLRRRSRSQDENEEEDDDPPPRRRRRTARDDDDDEEEKPRTRHRQPVDEDDGADEPPTRRRRSRDEDEEDEDSVPLRRARKNSEDEDDDPLPKRKRTRLEDNLDDQIPSKRRGDTSAKPASRSRSKDDDDDYAEEVVTQAKRQLQRLKDDEEEDDDPPPRRKRR